MCSQSRIVLITMVIAHLLCFTSFPISSATNPAAEEKEAVVVKSAPSSPKPGGEAATSSTNTITPIIWEMFSAAVTFSTPHAIEGATAALEWARKHGRLRGELLPNYKMDSVEKYVSFLVATEHMGEDNTDGVGLLYELKSAGSAVGRVGEEQNLHRIKFNHPALPVPPLRNLCTVQYKEGANNNNNVAAPDLTHREYNVSIEDKEQLNWLKRLVEEGQLYIVSGSRFQDADPDLPYANYADSINWPIPWAHHTESGAHFYRATRVAVAGPVLIEPTCTPLETTAKAEKEMQSKQQVVSEISAISIVVPLRAPAAAANDDDDDDDGNMATVVTS